MIINKFKKLLEKNPQYRLGHESGIADIKNHSFFDGFDWKKLTSKKLKAPYKPPIHDGLDVTESDINQINAGPKAEVDQFAGFTFIAARDNQIQVQPDNMATDSSSKTKKDKIHIRFEFKLTRAEGMPEKSEGQQYYVKWKSYGKRTQTGKTLYSTCVSRNIQWGTDNEENTAKFTTTMYRDKKTNSMDSHLLGIALHARDAKKPIGSVKIDLIDYCKHNYRQTHIIPIGKNMALTFQCKTAWRLFNGNKLQKLRGSEIDEIKDKSTILELNGSTYKLVSPKADLTNEISDLSLSSGGDDHPSPNKGKLSKSTSKSFLKRATSAKFSKSSSSTKNILAELDAADMDEDNEDSSDSSPSGSSIIHSSGGNKALKRATSARFIGKVLNATTSESSKDFIKKSGLNKIICYFKIFIEKGIELSPECNKNKVYLTWRQGMKQENSGQSEKVTCTHKIADFETNIIIVTSIYQSQSDELKFEEKLLHFSIKLDKEVTAKGTLNLAHFAKETNLPDDKKHSTTIGLIKCGPNADTLGPTIIYLNCETHWVQFNDEKRWEIPEEERKSFPLVKTHSHKTLRKMKSFLNKKKSESEISKDEKSENETDTWNAYKYYKGLEKTNRDLSQHIESLETSISEKNLIIDKLDDEKLSKTKKISEQETEIKNLLNKSNETLNKLNELENDLKNAKIDQNEKQLNIQSLQDQLNDIKSKFDQQKASYDSLLSSQASGNESQEKLLSEKQNLENSLKNLEIELQKQQELSNSYKNDISIWKQKADELQLKTNEIESKLTLQDKESKEKLEILQEQIKNQENQLSEWTSKYNELQSDFQSLKDSTELQNRKQEQERSILEDEIQNTKNKHSSLEESFSKFELAQKQIQNDLQLKKQQLEDDFNEKNDKLNQTELQLKELKIQSETEQKNYENQLKQLEIEKSNVINQLNDQIKDKDDKIGKLEIQVQEWKEKTNETESRTNKLIDEIREELKKERDLKEKNCKEIDFLQNDLASKLSDFKKQEQQLQDEINQQKIKIQEYEKQLQLWKEKYNEQESKNISLNEKISNETEKHNNIVNEHIHEITKWKQSVKVQYSLFFLEIKSF